MNYVKVSFRITPLEPGRDILYAELDELAVESAVDTDQGIDAFIPEDAFRPIENAQFPMTSAVAELSWETEEIAQQNWNAEWEKNFEPINVGNRLRICAPFHDSLADKFEYEIIIEPKMSFGTGHHQTTWLMCQYLLDLDLQGKDVLDMGCGTAVLAILAKMRGAAYTEGIDIETWAAENSVENATRNGFDDIAIFEGDVDLLGERTFDVIIANINRNILLNDLNRYVSVLRPNGTLLLSGFYESDVPVLEQAGIELGMKPEQVKTKDSWAALIWNND